MSKLNIVKTCIGCGQDKVHVAKGLCNACYCQKKRESTEFAEKHRASSRAYYHKHFDEVKAKMKTYRTSLEAVARRREYHKEYYSTPEQKHKTLLCKRRYREENPEKAYLISHRWATSPKGRISKALSSRLRRSKLFGLTHSFTYDEWLQKLHESGGVCQGCREYVGEDKLTLDHILPVSKAPEGFVYTIHDVQPLCGSCNSSKCDKSMEVFLNERASR